MKTLLTFAAAAALLLSPASARAQDFKWHGAVAQGKTIEIKGVNGDIRAEPSGGNEVEVTADKRATRDDPESVRIEVVPHGGGVTICAVYPSRSGARPNECAPGSGGRNNVQNNDVTVRFTVHVPAGVTFVGQTVIGQVDAERLNGDVDLSTVNGSVNFNNNSVIDPDGNEVQTNTIHGNLNCSGNTPGPQMGDSGGSPNTVTGSKTGQCTNV